MEGQANKQTPGAQGSEGGEGTATLSPNQPGAEGGAAGSDPYEGLTDDQFFAKREAELNPPDGKGGEGAGAGAQEGAESGAEAPGAGDGEGTPAGAQEGAADEGGEGAGKENTASSRLAEVGAEVNALVEETWNVEAEIARLAGTPPPPRPGARDYAVGTDAAKSINHAVRDRYQAQRGLEAKQALLETMRGGGQRGGEGGAGGTEAAAGQPHPDDPPRPDPDAVDKDGNPVYETADDYAIALGEWGAQVKINAWERERQAAGAKSASEDALQAKIRRYGESIQAESEHVPTLRQELDELGGLTLPRPIVEAVLETDRSALVALELARSPETLERLAQSDDRAAARIIGRIEAQVDAKYPKTQNGKGGTAAGAGQNGAGAEAAGGEGAAGAGEENVSGAPAPLNPQGGGRSSGTVNLEDLSDEEYIKRRNADAEKKGERMFYR